MKTLLITLAILCCIGCSENSNPGSVVYSSRVDTLYIADTTNSTDEHNVFYLPDTAVDSQYFFNPDRGDYTLLVYTTYPVSPNHNVTYCRYDMELIGIEDYKYSEAYFDTLGFYYKQIVYNKYGDTTSIVTRRYL